MGEELDEEVVEAAAVPVPAKEELAPEAAAAWVLVPAEELLLVALEDSEVAGNDESTIDKI